MLGNTKLQELGLQGREEERRDSKNYTLKRENSNFELTYIRTFYMFRFMQLKGDAGKPCQLGCSQVRPNINGLVELLSIYFGKKLRLAHCKLRLTAELMYYNMLISRAPSEVHFLGAVSGHT